MYTLELTEDDISAIGFVGGRYEWSAALVDAGLCSEPGTHQIPEYQAWNLIEAFNRDTEGGHSYFPMLDQRSELAAKLYAFMDAIV